MPFVSPDYEIKSNITSIGNPMLAIYMKRALEESTIKDQPN